GAVQAVLAQLSLKVATTDVVEKEAESTRETIETAFGNLTSLLNGRMEVESARERARRALAFGAQQLANASAELASTSMSTMSTFISSPDDEATTVDTSLALPPGSFTTSTTTASALPSTPLPAPVTLQSAPPLSQPQQHHPPTSTQQQNQSDLSITDLALQIKTVGQLMCEWRQGSGGRQPLQERVKEGDESLMKGSGSARKQLSRWRLVVALVDELSAGREETVVVTAMDKQMAKEKVGLRALAEKRGEQRMKWIECLDFGTTSAPSPL
ncbi:hypothetical protein A4X13_0g8818, partial [Tilletia indica]